eukprot:jgi/Botrbrau1/17914/Bobra.50_1s0015.1
MELAGPVIDSSVLKLSWQIKNIINLPFDVLIKILASVDLSTLRMSRLVCKAFCRASIPCISSLQCNCVTINITAAQLAHGLSVFSSITKLHLAVALPHDASMLVLPAVLSTLRSLTLEFVGNQDAVSHSWEAIVPRLAGATQLTALTIARVAVQGAGFKLADSLRAFTALEELAVHAIPAGEAETLAEAVLQLPRLQRLQKLRSLFVDDRFMDVVVLNASRLTRLQSLTWVIGSQARLEHLALLTQLTFLECDTRSSTVSPHLVQLSHLTSLQVLRLCDRLPSIDQLSQLVSPMTGLRDLLICSPDPDIAFGLDPLLARLPMITKLGLSGLPIGASGLPVRLLPNGFASLRAVSLWLLADEPTNVVQLAEAFRGLESLKLVCESAVAQKFLSHLPCLGRLTELVLSQFLWSASFPGLTSVSFLEELQNLKRLVLDNAVDVVAWDGGLKYLALLTNLTELGIRHSWPAQPLTSAQVQPLTGLIRLEKLSCSTPWGDALGRAVQGRQHELGLRRCHNAFHGRITWPW